MRNFVFAVLILAFATPLAAQDPDTTELPTGVRLGLLYQTLKRPVLAMRTIEGEFEVAGVAEEVDRIIRRDLDYSDRFEIFSVPQQLEKGPVDYDDWNEVGVVYLVTGQVELGSEGYILEVALHDVVYGRLSEARGFEIPVTTDPDFRMTVHAIADEIVRWATGQPGMAASRIAFVSHNADGTHDLMLVDSDGENLRRVTTETIGMTSPAWSPDARRIAYSVLRDSGIWEVVEYDLESGRTRTLSARDGANITPTYSPDGKKIALSIVNGRALNIYDYDIEQGCCLRLLRSGPSYDISPHYSPDGSQIVFVSDRLGRPHIYTMPADGGEATLISPYVYGEPGSFYSPEWSPQSSLIAFHGALSRQSFQLMVLDLSRRGATIQQITREGESEDPTWAPDGRHLAFAGTRQNGSGIFMIDIATGRTRPLALGRRMRLPAWSPPLKRVTGRPIEVSEIGADETTPGEERR